jgi:hypothetical protein
MPVLVSRCSFFDSEEGRKVSHLLEHMVDDSMYNTASSYSANSSLYPDNLIPFVDKHMNYLNSHPKLDAGMYLANLRLMTKIKHPA